VARELRHVGFDDGEIAAVLGGNFRRIAEQVWR
jgi:microsomal dipeptidase-like Zn-dependent dipeptidase